MNGTAQMEMQQLDGDLQRGPTRYISSGLSSFIDLTGLGKVLSCLSEGEVFLSNNNNNNNNNYYYYYY